VKYFAWDDAKNAKLRKERGIGFEDIVFHIERGDVLDILEHPNPDRYGGQRIFVVRREDYVYLVPFVEDEHTVFLKTIIPIESSSQVRVRAPQGAVKGEQPAWGRLPSILPPMRRTAIPTPSTLGASTALLAGSPPPSRWILRG
jgi:uncharacterized DUF497 family protein